MKEASENYHEGVFGYTEVDVVSQIRVGDPRTSFLMPVLDLASDSFLKRCVLVMTMSVATPTGGDLLSYSASK